jgi:phage terminase large subunit
MDKIKLKANKAFRPVLMAAQPMQILFGGSSSGKSRFVAQRIFYDLVANNRNYLAVRKVARSLRDSVWKEFGQVINSAGASSKFKLNKTEMTATCVETGRQLVCFGLDNLEKLKSIVPESGVFTDTWVEEATELERDDLKQLIRRMRGKADVPKRVTMSFNPILREHWICQDYFEGWADDETFLKTPDLLILKTTYKDNEFLDPFEIKTLEDESDPYWHDVYTLGKWGVLGDLIFTNWEIRDILSDPIYETFDKFKNGLDFGFSNDPTAYNRLYHHSASKKIYITHEWSSTEVTNDQIADGIKPLLNGDYVVCDSAEPKSIKELCMHGVNAIGAKKGKDSVLHGIQWLKQREIIIDKRCVDTVKNFQTYHWKKNKAGNAINVPSDRNDDHIDDIRYALEDVMFADMQASVKGIKSRARG